DLLLIENQKIEFSVIADIDKVRDQWLALQSKGMTFCFQTYEWISTWIETIGKGRHSDIFFAQVFFADQLVCLIPFEITSGKWGRRLAIVGDPVSDYFSPSFDPSFAKKIDPQMWIKIWKGITNAVYNFSRFDYVYIYQIPESIDGVVNPLFWMNRSKSDIFCYQRILEVDVPTFKSKAFTSKMASDSKRRLRNLGELGTVKFMQADNTVDSNNIIEFLLEEKHNQLTSQNQVSIFKRNDIQQFFKKLFEHRSIAHLSVIQVDEKNVAAHFGAQWNNRFYYMVQAYRDGDWRKYAVSRLLLEWLFEMSIESSKSVFDFTIGAESYKSTWCNSEIRIGTVIDFKTTRGLIFHSSYLIRQWARSFFARTSKSSVEEKPVST
ncbi:MAG: GNAT family N-acetyltransferase, partial [Proteobacteria bacterium]|nr:GNAT family N-acetyltransferase [Pseudomonadota bacterium]